MVDDVVNLFAGKFVLDGYCHGTIGEGGQECHRPETAVPSAEGNFVAALYTTVLKQDVQLLNFSGYIMIL